MGQINNNPRVLVDYTMGSTDIGQIDNRRHFPVLNNFGVLSHLPMTHLRDFKFDVTKADVMGIAQATA